MQILIIALLLVNLVTIAAVAIVTLKELNRLNNNLGSGITNLAWEVSCQKKYIQELKEKLASKEYIEEEFNSIRARLTKEFGITNQMILKHLEGKVTKEDIRLSIKGELADEISKLAFTPLKIDLRK